MRVVLLITQRSQVQILPRYYVSAGQRPEADGRGPLFMGSVDGFVNGILVRRLGQAAWSGGVIAATSAGAVLLVTPAEHRHGLARIHARL